MGCQQAEEIEKLGKELRMTIEASIGESDIVAGRYASNGGPNDVSFANGDAIGLSVNGGDFVEWTYNGSWSQNGDASNWNNKIDNHAFRAFYPFFNGASLDNVPMPELTGQGGTMESVAECDFLYTTKTQNYGADGKVSFTDDDAFKHVSSLIALTIKGDEDLASATINKITMEGTNILTPSSYSFDTDEVSLDEDVNKAVSQLEAVVSHSMNSEDATFYFVVNSNTVNLSDVELGIEYEFEDDSQYKATHKGLNKNGVNDQFEKGKLYSYTLNIKDRMLIISGSSIANWVDGESLGDINMNGSKQEESEDEDA